MRLKIEIASALKEEGLPLNGSEPSVKAPRGGLVIMHRAVQPLSEVAAKPAFRTIDGVSIRFVESNRRNADALLLFAAAAHPRRFLSLVVGSGGTAVPIRLGDPLREWVFAPDLEPNQRPVDARSLSARCKP